MVSAYFSLHWRQGEGYTALCQPLHNCSQYFGAALGTYYLFLGNQSNLRFWQKLVYWCGQTTLGKANADSAYILALPILFYNGYAETLSCLSFVALETIRDTADFAEQNHF